MLIVNHLQAHHKGFNGFLNDIVGQTHPLNPKSGGKNRVQVHYKHRRETDRFFDLPPAMLDRLPGCMRARLNNRSKNVRVRVTHDQQTKEVLNKIVKARVADIDLHMPRAVMDCRLSINLEMNWDGSVEKLEQATNPANRQPDRNKDRLSYSQGHYQIDLTQVTQTKSQTGTGVSHAVPWRKGLPLTLSQGPQRLEKEHELEIELSPGILIEQGERAKSNSPHRYPELVEGLVDNVRLLARKASELG